MDYEKKYKNLVAAIKQLQEANPSDEGTQNCVEDNVPELMESEDDRIRKYLINYVKSAGVGNSIFDSVNTREKILAWLEKQGEQKPTVYVPKFRVGDVVISTKNHHLTYKVLEVGHINENGEPEYKVEIFVDGESSHPSNIKYIRIKMMDEWGSLIGKTTEWSEEDEKTLNSILTCIEYCYNEDTEAQYNGNHCVEPKRYGPMADWLKSLRPQPHWKPSEEQIWALDVALEGFYNQNDRTALESLCSELKKL